MTRTVEDAAIMFEAMAGADPHDPTSLPDPVPAVRAELGRGIAGLRVGFDRRYATDNVDPDVATAMDDVLAELTRLGATVVTVTMPDVSKVGSAWLDLVCCGGACRPCEDVSESGQRVRTGVSRCARVWSASHSRGAGRGRESSIRSLRVNRVHAEHRRLSGVSVDGEQCTREGGGSVRRRDRRIVERTTSGMTFTPNRSTSAAAPPCLCRAGSRRTACR